MPKKNLTQWENELYIQLLSCISSLCSASIPEHVANDAAAADRGNEGVTESLTGLFFLLAAPLGSRIEQHLLHLLQLLLHTVEVEVGALLRHGGKVCRSSERDTDRHEYLAKDDSVAEPGK